MCSGNIAERYKKLTLFLPRLYAFFFLIFLICYVPVKCQPLKKLNHTSYNVNEGLLHSQVIDLVEDGNGFIWVSSGSGVQRFDGKTFIQIPLTSDNSGIPDDKYVRLFRLQNGNLWLRHSEGISEYNIHTNRFHRIISRVRSDPDNNPFPVWETNDGVWCRLPVGGLYLLDKRIGHYADSISFPAIPLSRREQEILEQLSRGFYYKEIADKLSISFETVRTHIRHIYEKLQVNSRVEALKKTGLL